MLSKTKTCSIQGLSGHIIEVEVDVSSDQPPVFNIVGLPEKAIQESRERIRAAIANSGFEFPEQRITVSLAPADIRKVGTYYDLPVSVGILAASGQINKSAIEQILFLGELALDGKVRSTRGILPMVNLGKQKGYGNVFIPADNVAEASLIGGIDIFPVQDLSQLVEHLRGDSAIAKAPPADITKLTEQSMAQEQTLDMSDVRGHESAKDAMVIAAAGRHNVLLSGPPGTGKTLLARAMAGILPPMSELEIVEMVSAHSVVGLLDNEEKITFTRPFRSPHYTLSDVALIGGGSPPRPGEVTLSNHGVLFLDELPEFGRNVLETLRQPIEDREVTVTRIHGTVKFPANFMLVAAMNPCPCGFYSATQKTGAQRNEKQCVCTDGMIHGYKRRISGPLLSRIDIFLDVQRQDYEKLHAPPSSKNSEHYRMQVIKAQQMQQARFSGSSLLFNSDMGAKEVWMYCKLDEDAERLLKGSADKYSMSPRTIHRILKLARTIADMEQKDTIANKDILKALIYRGYGGADENI